MITRAQEPSFSEQPDHYRARVDSKLKQILAAAEKLAVILTTVAVLETKSFSSANARDDSSGSNSSANGSAGSSPLTIATKRR